MIIKTKNKQIPNIIDDVGVLEQFIIEHKLIKNLIHIPDFVKSRLDDIIDGEYTFTELKKVLNFIFESKTQLNSTYWECRGWDTPVDKVKELQKTHSKRCVEYWVHRGYSEDGALIKVSNIQSKYSKVSNSVSNKELRKRSHRCIEYWIDKGFDYNTAKLKVRKVNDTSSLKYYTEKFGKVDGYIKYTENNKLKANYGKQNPQYGKPAPIGSGNGISGYYKQYYFRSLYEYFAIKQFESNSIEFSVNDVSVKKHKNKVTIPYNYNGNEKTYIPDFIINNNTIVEVKPTYQLNTEIVKLKIKALENFINSNDRYKFYKVLTENDIFIDNTILIDDYNKNLINVDSGKLNRFKKYTGII